MNDVQDKSIRPHNPTIEAALKMLRYLGMLGFLGGLASLGSMWAFGPQPADVDQWRLLMGIMRPVFYACVFSGIVVLAVAGTISWWRHRKRFHSYRWFRVMLIMLVIAIPILHLWARGMALNLYAAIDAGELDKAASLWDQLGRAYVIGFVVMVLIAALGVIKPSLGQKTN